MRQYTNIHIEGNGKKVAGTKRSMFSLQKKSEEETSKYTIVFKYNLNCTAVGAASRCYWDELMLLVWTNAIKVWGNAIKIQD